MYISSMKNNNIKEIKSLRDKKDRDKKKLFLIEGYREIKHALLGEVKLKTLFICEDLFLKNNEYVLIKEIESKRIKIISCPKDIFEKISYRDRPDGLLAIAYQRKKTVVDLKALLKTTKNPFFVVAEHIEKPGNLGTILRSCDGVKVDAVIICDACTDIFNPNVVRASIGSLFTQPIIEGTTQEIIKFFKENKIQIVATTPHSNSCYTEANFTQPIAIIVGTEQYGLSKQWLNSCDMKLRIPMKGIADSLNVGAATTILVYEVLRQRKSS